MFMMSLAEGRCLHLEMTPMPFTNMTWITAYVDANSQSIEPNGLSWEDAFYDLQVALEITWEGDKNDEEGPDLAEWFSDAVRVGVCFGQMGCGL